MVITNLELVKTMSSYKFYMQRYPISGVAQAVKDLEVDFVGLKVKSVSDLSDKGAIKSIVEEKFPENTAPRVYISPTTVRDTLEVVITLLFTGASRRSTYDSFVYYITGHKLYYWDSARNRKISIYNKSEIKPSDDVLKGSVQYIEVPFKFSALEGSSVSV